MTNYAQANWDKIQNSNNLRQLGRGGADIKGPDSGPGVRADQLRKSAEKRIIGQINDLTLKRLRQRWSTLLNQAINGASDQQLRIIELEIIRDYADQYSSGSDIANILRDAAKQRINELRNQSGAEVPTQWDATMELI